MQRIKLFCIPYAGGSAAVFRDWDRFLDPRIEVRPVELSGRGRRGREPHYTSFEAAVDDVFASIDRLRSGAPYALLGHSMGGQIAYAVAERLRNSAGPSAVHLFISASDSPFRGRPRKIRHLLPDAELRHELDRMGGTPREILDDPALMGFFLPLIRNDFRIIEQRTPPPPVRSLDLDLTVLFAKDDDAIDGNVADWSQVTKGRCHFQEMAGGHFYCFNDVKPLLRVIEDRLIGVDSRTAIIAKG